MPSASFDHRIHELRGVAVLGVLLHHLLPRALPGGFLGVDVFFVISGFLITRWILARHSMGAATLLKAFFWGRVHRLLPALLAMVGVIYGVGLLFLFPTELRFLGKHGFAGLIGGANLSLWTETGYFDPGAETKPFMHLWSLGVEEQFYVVWPLLLLLSGWLASRFRKNSRSIALSLTLALWGISLGIFLVTRDTWPDVAFFLPFARAWELLTGCIVALIIPAAWAISERNTPAMFLMLFGATTVLAGFVLAEPSDLFSGLYPFAVIGASALFIIGSQMQTRAARRRSKMTAPLWFFGEISYPLYLWHWPLIVFYNLIFWDSDSTISKFLLASFSIVLASLSTRFIERPFRGGRFTS